MKNQSEVFGWTAVVVYSKYNISFKQCQFHCHSCLALQTFFLYLVDSVTINLSLLRLALFSFLCLSSLVRNVIIFSYLKFLCYTSKFSKLDSTQVLKFC